MKKLFTASVLMLSSMSVMAATTATQGGFKGPAEVTPTVQPAQGGFKGPNAVPALNTVKAVLNANDEATVELTGHIMSSLGHEDYLFKDATGEITVEIDHKDWHGVTVTPTTKVVLRGEVDKDWTTRTVDVDTVSVAN